MKDRRDSNELTLLMRPGFIATVVIPLDLTEKEAEWLSKILLALPLRAEPYRDKDADAKMPEPFKASIKKKTSEALMRLKNDNKAYCQTPYGYNRVGDDFVYNSKEQSVISRMRRMRKKGRSFRAIVTWLNSNGVPSKKGGKWYPSSVRNILRRGIA